MIYIGIDWSVQKHDVVFMNQAGVPIAKVSIAASLEGFLEIDAVREQIGVAPTECQVALETAHNLVIDFLWSWNYQQVFVVPPNVVKSTRGRYRQSGARNLRDALEMDKTKAPEEKPPMDAEQILPPRRHKKLDILWRVGREGRQALLGKATPSFRHTDQKACQDQRRSQSL